MKIHLSSDLRPVLPFCGPLESDGDSLVGLDPSGSATMGGEGLLGESSFESSLFAAKAPTISLGRGTPASELFGTVSGARTGFFAKPLPHSHGGHHLPGPVVLKAASFSPGVAPADPATALTQAQVDALSQGFEQQLTSIEGNLVAQVFGDSLPLFGTKLADAAASGVPALHYVTALKTAVNAGLGTLNGGGPYTESQVESAISSALNSAGISGSAPDV